MIQFTVPAVPVPQPRAKPTKRGKFMGVYTPDTIKTSLGRQPHPIVGFKYAVEMAAREAMVGLEPLKGPIVVSQTFVFPRDNEKLRRRTAPQARVPHVKRPDRDNLDKAVLDAITGICFDNDWQVWDGRITKVYAAVGEQPHVEVTIETEQAP